MKISTAALPFLMLAAALGPPAHGAPAHVDFGLQMLKPDQSIIGQTGVHRPSDCCSSYTLRNIRCVFMDSYYTTSSDCSQPGVIFKTKRGREVCARPSGGEVRECIEKLASKNTLGTWLVEEKLQ